MVKLCNFYLLYMMLNYISAAESRMVEPKTITIPEGITKVLICLNRMDEAEHYSYRRSVEKKEPSPIFNNETYTMHSFQITADNYDIRYPLYCKNGTLQRYSLPNVDAEIAATVLRTKRRLKFVGITFCQTKYFYNACHESGQYPNSTYTSVISDTPTNMCEHLFEDHIWAFCYSKLEIITSGKTEQETIRQMLVDEIVHNNFQVDCWLNISKKFITFKLMKGKTQLKLYDIEYENSTFTDILVAGERRSYYCDSYEFVNSSKSVTVRFTDMKFQARSTNQVGPYFRFGPIGFGCSEDHQCKHCMGLRIPYWIIRLFWHYKILYRRYQFFRVPVPTNYTDMYE